MRRFPLGWSDASSVWRFPLIVLASALVTSLLPIATPASAAAVFIVNSIADAIDTVPGNGACSTADGKCTLRAAVMEANALAGRDTIEIPNGVYKLTIAGMGEDAAATGDLDITDDLILVGAGDQDTVIDANGLDRAIHIVDSGTDAQIDGVHITGGKVGAGIHNGGSLTLTWSTVSNNVSDDGAGGISNSGVLVISDTLIFDNDTGMGGAGIHSSAGSMTIAHSAVFDNGKCSITGGIRSYATKTVVVDSYIGFNNEPTCGHTGGISNDGGGSMTISGTTIEGNYGVQGGGIYNADATLAVINSTITGNTARESGGGIYSRSGSVSLNNVTLAGNASPTGGGIYKELGAFASLANSIVWGNEAADGMDCFGTFASLDYNLIGETADCTLSGGATHDLTGLDPRLGPLQDNGGPTDTRDLSAGSPAIDAGNPSTPGSTQAACAPVDQRGIDRPQGDRCDIGAYERSNSFVDDDDSTFTADIEWLAAEGITKGCNPPTNDRFCPDDYVTRGQMAAFLVRAFGYTDNGGGNLFIDDNGSTFETDIDRLGTAGVTKGCNPPTNNRFCPDDYVTRGQMAAFLHRAFGG